MQMMRNLALPVYVSRHLCDWSLSFKKPHALCLTSGPAKHSRNAFIMLLLTGWVKLQVYYWTGVQAMAFLGMANGGRPANSSLSLSCSI